ncbi:MULTISPECIES: helix-turn-helix domain-containing protein [Bradyrhizobium]|jgi:AraC-like DNA-binding protein|uniref:helix-turn-helix domain-containing protein n=1 Tax=Bradyrhizobium TaxID=374 RepID=UPI000487A56C|nr:MULTISPECIES: helix-turn-helix domain-containing protein [Bradyrhizobium]MCS3450181.1 AraC-like DNA-binding protein [Bradyrhizobium elkanii]MCS3558675.1 AraC-like DNA-binding protein [Bradyrhizobium elkanii]MCW2151478.1 AraC-like DNA-binding protein [Bradyrhizobium elkanii]MCW2358649.1 AraC-like DNA-binding protein [Bradyrhizobium elkanii]MCW2375209.1 AraC-like DNA-binding protein [Bradyrhizobium elkanii]
MPFWTTHDLPSDQQFGFWREVLCQAFITLNPTRKSRGAFSGSVEANLLSDVNVTRLLTEEHRVIRGAKEIRKTPLEYYFVNMQIKGDVLAKQRGREVLIKPHEFYVVDSTEPYDLDYRSDLEIFSFRVPKRRLDPLLKNASGSTAIRVSRETPTGRLAVDFLQSVLEQPQLPPEAGETLADMIAKLVALSLGGSSQVVETAEPSARRALLGSILRYIDVNSSNPALSVEAACRRFHITPRYLHRLFETAGTTFGATIREKRLKRCAFELSRTPDRPIATVAFACGFNDISYFNRLFKKTFDASPTEYRRIHLHER